MLSIKKERVEEGLKKVDRTLLREEKIKQMCWKNGEGNRLTKMFNRFYGCLLRKFLTFFYFETLKIIKSN